MALDTGRPYFSIGEVLNVLKDSFPDVTVSKIRFLESEGLIQPERTSSGYRKFTEADIERLRFILKLQRDHFLPLKVIRERLDELDSSPDASAQSRIVFEELDPAAGTSDAVSALAAGSGASLSIAELAGASGLTPQQIEELMSYRLLDPMHLREERQGAEPGQEELRFDESDLEAAKLCRALLDLGLEPRHLRVFRVVADRQADLARQMAMPLARMRNPEARKATQEQVRELLRVGGKLVRTLLRDAVESIT